MNPKWAQVHKMERFVTPTVRGKPTGRRDGGDEAAIEVERCAMCRAERKRDGGIWLFIVPICTMLWRQLNRVYKHIAQGNVLWDLTYTMFYRSIKEESSRIKCQKFSQQKQWCNSSFEKIDEFDQHNLCCTFPGQTEWLNSFSPLIRNEKLDIQLSFVLLNV